MEFSLASNYFDETTLEGWNGASWDAAVVKGNFEVFGRFISDRGFRQKYRNFTTGGDPLPAQYEAVRLPTGEVYLVEGTNIDIKGVEAYVRTYLLHEASLTLDVVRITTTPRLSGAGGTPVETNPASGVFCDVEHYSGRGSPEFDTVRYGIYEFFMPASTPIATSDFIDHGGERYNVTDIMTQLGLKKVRAAKASAS